MPSARAASIEYMTATVARSNGETFDLNIDPATYETRDLLLLLRALQNSEQVYYCPRCLRPSLYAEDLHACKAVPR